MRKKTGAPEAPPAGFDRDFSKDVEVDIDSLEVEWMTFPMTFAQYAEEAARAKDLVRQADEKVQTTRSELILKARRESDTIFPGGKATEGSIEAWYRTHPDFMAAVEESNKAKYESDMAIAAVESLKTKRDALDGLVKLHGQQYFAGPSTPRSAEMVAKGKAERARQKVKERMK